MQMPAIHKSFKNLPQAKPIFRFAFRILNHGTTVSCSL